MCWKATPLSLGFPSNSHEIHQSSVLCSHADISSWAAPPSLLSSSISPAPTPADTSTDIAADTTAVSTSSPLAQSTSHPTAASYPGAPPCPPLGSTLLSGDAAWFTPAEEDVGHETFPSPVFSAQMPPEDSFFLRLLPRARAIRRRWRAVLAGGKAVDPARLARLVWGAWAWDRDGGVAAADVFIGNVGDGVDRVLGGALE